MATDQDGNIIFVNKAAAELMREVQPEIRKSMPGFDVSRVLGSNIDVFYKRHGLQPAVLEVLHRAGVIQPFLDDVPLALRSINSDALDMLNLKESAGKQVIASASTPSPSETPLHLAWQLSGDKQYLEKLYGTQIETAVDRQFINTEGSLWIDRIYFNSGELQRARLGGVALTRNYIYPGNAVSWKFEAPGNDQSDHDAEDGNRDERHRALGPP